jgi:hypothetical protein
LPWHPALKVSGLHGGLQEEQPQTIRHAMTSTASLALTSAPFRDRALVASEPLNDRGTDTHLD